MKKIALIIVLLAIGAGGYWLLDKPSAAQFELEDGYSYLYDGKSLAGWQRIGGKSTFAAMGEDIVGTHGPGKNTFLRTNKEYGDFSLKLQMRWDELGNSGILFRARQREGSGRAYGYQFELDHSDRAWSGGIYDEARRGWLADLASNPVASAAIKLDDWNDIEIEARGALIKTWINGVPAAEIIDGLDASGFIALQVHSGDVGIMRWRRIRIRELPGMSTEGESLLKPGEWRLENLSALDFASGEILGDVPEGEFWITPRRQFKDAMFRMSPLVCAEPTTIRLRYREQETGAGAAFAEVKIFADRAEGRVVTPGKEQLLDTTALKNSPRQQLTAVTLGNSVVITIGEQDVMRLDHVGLPERGRLRIQPGRCGRQFSIDDFQWFTLTEQSDEPLFYQTLDQEPAPVLSPQEALDAFRIAPGFDIELVAAEPLVEDPVAMAWDEYGRLYVVELRGYMPDAYGTGSDEPVGQVVRLQDTDGDGQMDKSEVFLGELVNPRAVAVVNEGVLIAEPPNLWLCSPATAAALCDNKRRIGEYAADVGSANVEHMENGLRQGLDNWLYNSKSDRRLKIVDGKLQAQPGKYRGQWGITKDNVGRLLYNHNSTWIQADLFAAEDLLEPGVNSTTRGLGVNLTNPPEVFSVRVNPGVNRAYLDNTLRPDGRLFKATGVSGLVSYRGDQFPAEYLGDVFVPEVAGNVVARFALAEQGMELVATQHLVDDEQWGKRDFLGSTDERFRPVDAMNGPDGALYIIDMYRGIVQDDHFLTDELREQIFQRQLDTPLGMGRIWRVTHSKGKAVAAVTDLDSASGTELVAALAHDNGWVRDTAQRLLLDRRGELQVALSELARADNTLAALHAIWTLQGRAELDSALVMQLAVGGDPQRQVHALRAGRMFLDAQQLLSLYETLRDAPEAVRMQLAFAMGDHADDSGVQDALVGLLGADNRSVYLSQAVVRSARGHELAMLPKVLAQLPKNGRGARAALQALAGSAYRSLRGDLTSDAPANPALLELLQLVASRSGNNAWQQIAMLAGLAGADQHKGFVPAQLAAAPAIFADGSVSEENPLWQARLKARPAFTWPGDELALGMKPLSPEQLKLVALGEAFYPQCGACHGDAGQGTPGLAPALAGASWVTGPPEWLGRIILQGMSGPIKVNGEAWEGVMPAHGHVAELDDATLAGLMTFLRRNWGNTADPVSAERVQEIRTASAARAQAWTADELKAVAYDRGYRRYVGKYAVSFLTVTVSEQPEGLHLAVPMYGGGIMQPVTDTVFMAEAGGEKVKLEFIVADDGAVNELLLHRDGEKIPVKRVPD